MHFYLYTIWETLFALVRQLLLKGQLKKNVCMAYELHGTFSFGTHQGPDENTL